MYTSISFSLEFDKMIFDIVFDPFSSICSFFLVNLLAPYIVIFHLITLKRLLLQNTDLIYLSWFTFYNFFCTKSLKIAKKFLTIMYTVKKKKTSFVYNSEVVQDI